MLALCLAWDRERFPSRVQTVSQTQALGSAGVGKRFLEHFEADGFEVIPGSSLLDPSVPMSFVMSAGLVQVETSAILHGGRSGDRYALLQNCFRHFDLDRVGGSDTHLSLFQMPGAFAFGPVNKRDRIAQTWALLTEAYGFRADALWVTYFAGDEVAGHSFGPDQEAYQTWCDLGVPIERIVGLGRAQFLEAGRQRGGQGARAQVWPAHRGVL